MPANTPRGYSYPLYTDAHDFPAAIQDLATDIDTDVQAQVNLETNMLDQPSARVSANAPLVIASNTDVTVTYATEEYDNGGLFVIGSPTIFTFTELGLYWIEGGAEWSSNADSTTSACQLRLVSSAFGIRAAHSPRRGVDSTPDTIGAYVNVSCLHEITVVGETISMVARHNLPVASQLTNRHLTATKISEDN
jgi:hypothetical protein